MKKRRIDAVAEVFSMLGNKTRLKILGAISRKERSIKEISEKIRETHSLVSHNIRQLKKRGLVSTRKSGKNSFCRINEQDLIKIISKCSILTRKKRKDSRN